MEGCLRRAEQGWHRFRACRPGCCVPSCRDWYDLGRSDPDVGPPCPGQHPAHRHCRVIAHHAAAERVRGSSSHRARRQGRYSDVSLRCRCRRRLRLRLRPTLRPLAQHAGSARRARAHLHGHAAPHSLAAHLFTGFSDGTRFHRCSAFAFARLASRFSFYTRQLRSRLARLC